MLKKRTSYAAFKNITYSGQMRRGGGAVLKKVTDKEIQVITLGMNFNFSLRTDMNGKSLSVAVFHRELEGREDAHDVGES